MPFQHDARAAHMWKNGRRRAKRSLLIIFPCLLFLSVAAQPPVINFFSPTSGPIGTTVIITGTNFNATSANNIVYFGAVKAIVSAASTTSLTVTVPVGATYQPVTVTTGNLTGYSDKPFIITFPANTTGFNSNSFAAKVDYSIGSGGSIVNTSDLNGDGKVDMVVANTNYNSIIVFTNTSTTGVVSYNSNGSLQTGTNVNSLALADLDGDGKTDIVVTNSSSKIVSVLKNTSTSGTISFAAKVDIATVPYTPGSVTVSDLDGDGKPDLAVTLPGYSTLSLFRNVSTGGTISFAATIDISGISNNKLTIGDIDGDRKPDLVVPNYYSGTVSVFRNTGVSGVFSFSSSVDFVTGVSPSATSVGDLDMDGKPDLAVVNYNSGTVSIFRNGSAGGTIAFAAKQDYTTGSKPIDISIADLDGDGRPDLAVANEASFTVAILKNTGVGGTVSFAASADYTTAGSINNITIADADNDGKPDLFTTIYSPGTISIFRNQTDGPNITAFTPTNAGIGTTITLTGTGFTGTVSVKLGGITASSFTVVSDTVITAVVAAAAGGNVTVTSPKGIATLNGFYNGPVITSFTPASGPVGTTVTITGSNFNPTAAGNTVYFGAVKAVVSAASTTSLTVTVPVGATYQPMTITASNLTAYAAKPFVITFPGSTPGFTANSFAAKTDVITGNSPYAVATGDLDGDGKPDLVTVNYSTGSISIIKNGSTSGTVSFNSKVDVSAGYYLYNLAIGDIDGDGKLDVAVVNSNSYTISVYRNTSSGGIITFATYLDLYTGSGNQPRSVAISDLDGDGKPDLAVSNYTGSLCFFRNLSTIGSVLFAGRLDYPSEGGRPLNLAVSDINGDGKADLVVTNYAYYATSLAVSIFKNVSISGAISFGSKLDYILSAPLYSNINDPFSVAIGDMDGDGKPDLTVANYNSNTVSVYRNQTTGGIISFATRIDYPTGTGPYQVSIGDLDGDGKPDLAVDNAGSATVSIFKNQSTTGTVSFAPKTDYATGTTPQSISIGDLDGDGKPDLTIANAGTNTVSILTNLIGTPAITSFTPANGNIGTAITITGNRFTSATAVSFGGIPASSFTVVSDTVVTAVVGGIGGGSVAVTTAGGTAMLAGFYNAHSITSFLPASGPVGTMVTIKGSGFSTIPTNNTVYFGAVKAVISAASDTSLTVLVPAGTTYQPITVTINSLTVYTAKPFVVTFASSAIGFASNSFAAKKDYITGVNSSNVAISDLDGDGKPDLVVVNYNSSTISVLKNGSTVNSVSFAAKVDYTAGSLPFSMAIGDINGDGKPDLVVANIGSNTVSILKNTSTGGTISFAPKTDYSTENGPISVAIGDLDGDGKPDLAVVNTVTYNVSVYKNTGTAGAVSFAPRMNYATGNTPYSIAISDMDGDGKPDLLIANANSYSTSVLRNTSIVGAVSFAPKSDYTAGTTPYSVAVGDVDGDGKVDLVVANGSDNTVSVLRNTSIPGTVSFATKVDYATGTDSRSIAMSDIDGDGKPDLAVANNSSNTISVLKNGSISGTISFSTKVDYATGVNPRGIAAGDLTGDGKPDIAAANYSSGTVSILRNDLSDPDLCPGGNISFTSNVTGTNYQWQVNTGSGFTNISDNSNYSGTNAITLQVINAPSAWYGYQYRCVADGTNSNIFTLQFKNYWTGAASAAWENAANWSCGVVPDGNIDVIISAGTVIVNSAAACRSLKINPGVSYTVKSGYNMTITH